MKTLRQYCIPVFFVVAIVALIMFMITPYDQDWIYISLLGLFAGVFTAKYEQGLAKQRQRDRSDKFKRRFK